MKKNLSTRGAAALLALAMGCMGQGVAQAAYIQPKSAQPIEELEFDVNCFDMHFLLRHERYDQFVLGGGVPA